MGHSTAAIKKGDYAEALVRTYFSGQGYTVLTAETHENHYDFVAEIDGVYSKVQVKCCVSVGFKDTDHELIRIRNKRGQNGLYKKGDYDVLVGVWIEGGKMFFFNSDDVIEKDRLKETITVCRSDGTPALQKCNFRPEPYLTVDFKFPEPNLT